MSLQNLQFTADECDVGQRLDQVLARRYPEFSRAYVQKQIAAEQILLNGRAARKGDVLKSGDCVEIVELLEKRERRPASNPNLIIPIVYEDEWIAVVNKPAGIPTHPVRDDETGTVVNWWAAKNPDLYNDALEPMRAGVVHRLDTGTSGLMILGRNQTVVDAMQGEFRARRVHKEYLALVYGSPPDKGAIDFPIAHDPKSKRRMMALRDRSQMERFRAREARTEFEVEKRFKEVTLVRVHTKTGRMHQVRVHMTALAFPLVGDRIYKRGNMADLKLELSHHFLHACRLKFHHPFQNAPKAFESDLPLELQNVLAACSPLNA